MRSLCCAVRRQIEKTSVMFGHLKVKLYQKDLISVLKNLVLRRYLRLANLEIMSHQLWRSRVQVSLS